MAVRKQFLRDAGSYVTSEKVASRDSGTILFRDVSGFSTRWEPMDTLELSFRDGKGVSVSIDDELIPVVGDELKAVDGGGLFVPGDFVLLPETLPWDKVPSSSVPQDQMETFSVYGFVFPEIGGDIRLYVGSETDYYDDNGDLYDSDDVAPDARFVQLSRFVRRVSESGLPVAFKDRLIGSLRRQALENGNLFVSVSPDSRAFPEGVSAGTREGSFRIAGYGKEYTDTRILLKGREESGRYSRVYSVPCFERTFGLGFNDLNKSDRFRKDISRKNNNGVSM